MNVSKRIIQIAKPQASDGVVSIAEQLGYGYDLVAPARRGERMAEVIDLSNPAPARPPGGPPRLVNGRRSKYPVLPAWPSEDGRTLIVLCPWCGRHTHGRHGADEDCGPECPCQMHGGNHHARRVPCLCRPGSGDGHRTAHCADLSRSPLKAAGYVVREVRP